VSASASATPLKVKPRINALAQYLMALAFVIGAYSCYLKFAVPVLEGPPNIIPQVEVVSLDELPPQAEEKLHLAPYLPRNSWEMADCKTLIVETGTILFKELEEQPDGSLKVVPFTLISGINETPNDQTETKPKIPTILRCVQGAILRFDKPMAEVYSGKAQLETARLSGNVDIYRPPSNSQNNDSMHVLTSNVQVDKNRIYTLDNVQFVFGLHRGSGRNLLIELTHQENPLGNDFDTIEGVKRMELAFLHNLRIEPSEDSNSMPLKNGVLANSKRQLFSNQSSPIEVACSGPFIFDFESNTASFQDQVVARQVDAFQDTIECEKLTLSFLKKEKEEPDSNLPAFDIPGEQQPQSKQESPGELELKSFVAQGNPATVTSRSSSARVSGEHLSYDVLTGKFSGHCSQQNNLLVTIVSPEYQIVSKKLEYIATENDSLGMINATGAGRMLRVGTADQDEFFASWTKSLTTRPMPDQPGLKQIVLEGKTKVRLGGKTNANADQIEVHVWETEVNSPVPESTAQTKTQKTSWEYTPFQLVARGNVEIESPKFTGTTNKLTAHWPNSSPHANSATDHRVGYRGTLKFQSAETNNVRPITKLQPLQPANQNATQSNYSNGFVELASFNQEVKTRPGGSAEKTPTKIKFRGDEVEMKLVGDGKESTIADLKITGNVNVTQLKKPGADPNEIPLTINGDHLRMIPQSKESYRALITSGADGSAQINAKDLELRGETIHLDQDANKVWVEGEGTMKLETDPRIDKRFNQTEPAQVGNAIKQSVPDDLNVAWAGGMIFDGSKIYFEQKVVMSAIQNNKQGRSVMKSLSEGLSVQLDRAVDFSQLSQNKKIAEETKVRELVFVNDINSSQRVFQLAAHTPAQKTIDNQYVVIENRRFDLSGKMVEKQNVVVPKATVRAENGSLYAKGPGTIGTHRYGSSSGSGNPFASLTREHSGKKKDGLSYIQVNFDGELDINSDKKQMLVEGNVRTVYAPIGSWNQTFNPDDSRKQAPPGSVNLTCQRLRIDQWTPRGSEESFSELLATGNTHIFSETFESTADRISYNQSNDMLVVEGTTRNDAQLWFKESANDRTPTHLVAEKISYRPNSEEQWTHTQGVSSLEINGR